MKNLEVDGQLLGEQWSAAKDKELNSTELIKLWLEATAL